MEIRTNNAAFVLSAILCVVAGVAVQRTFLRPLYMKAPEEQRESKNVPEEISARTITLPDLSGMYLSLSGDWYRPLTSREHFEHELWRYLSASSLYGFTLAPKEEEEFYDTLIVKINGQAMMVDRFFEYENSASIEIVFAEPDSTGQKYIRIKRWKYDKETREFIKEE